MTFKPVVNPSWLGAPSSAVHTSDDTPCDADLGKLGVDGLKRMIAFPAIALTRGPGATYVRTRVCPFDCIASRIVIAPSAAHRTSITLTLWRQTEQVLLLNHEAEDPPPLGLTLRSGDVLELAVHDRAPRPAYWSNRAGRWYRCFGAAIITDHLASFGRPAP